jgi:hypothetical protein
MRKADDDSDLGPEQRDGRPAEERTAGEPARGDDEDVPDEETIESVGY